MPPGAALAFLVLALLNNVIPFVLFAWAQEEITGGLASILNATTPIWGVIVAHLFTADEKATPGKVAGVLLGFGGVAVMIGADLLGEIGDERARPARLPGRDPLLRARRRLGAPLPRHGRAAGRGLDRPAHRRRDRDAAAGAALRAALAGRRAVGRGLGRAGRAGPVLHQPRLHPLFPAARLGRRDQFAARHLPDPDHRDPARRADPRRAARAAPFRRHGADRPRPGGDRRAAVRRASAAVEQFERDSRRSPMVSLPASGCTETRSDRCSCRCHASRP